MIIDVKLSFGFRSVNADVLFVTKNQCPLVSVIRKERGSELRPGNANGFFISISQDSLISEKRFPCPPARGLTIQGKVRGLYERLGKTVFN